MNRRSVLMMLGLTALPNSAISQQWSIKDQLVGTWTLASWEHALPNGSKVQSYGTNPKGIVVFDAKGRFFLMFARPDLPKIASDAPATATSEEAKDLLAGSIAYFSASEHSVDLKFGRAQGPAAWRRFKNLTVLQ